LRLQTSPAPSMPAMARKLAVYLYLDVAPGRDFGQQKVNRKVTLRNLAPVTYLSHTEAKTLSLKFLDKCSKMLYSPPALRSFGNSCMDRIIISPAEIGRTEVSPDVPARMQPTLEPAVPRWAKWTLSPLVLVLPLLCLVAILMRVA